MSDDLARADLVIHGIGQAYTANPAGQIEPSDAGLARSTFVPELLADAGIACVGDRIVYVGPTEGLEEHVDTEGALTINADGRLATPGLVDCHTHLVFHGWRYEEYALRSTGSTYQEIAEAGGGIRSSVRSFRAAGEDELLATARERLDQMIRSGTTAVEVKSGYGLSTESELKALSVIGRLAEDAPVRVVPTFLGAHEVPDEYREDRDGYLDLVEHEMLPAVAEQGIARYCDVFCETGVFDAAESERVLRAAQQYGLGAKIHSDEFDAIGGTEMAAAIEAASADHLTALTDEGIDALAGSRTVPVLLPGTTLFLGKTDFAPARGLLEHGSPVALATDFNPGSSTLMSLPLIATIACSQMNMHPAEALQGITTNAARAIGMHNQIGRLEAGMAADIVIWDADDYRIIPYAAGHPIVWKVIAGGSEAG
jgi:imidazolonepropionase